MQKYSCLFVLQIRSSKIPLSTVKKRRVGASETWSPQSKENLNSINGLSLLPCTPIDIDRLSQELKEYPDEQFRNYLLDGLRYGFNTGLIELPRNSIECKNLQSAISQKECVSELIDTEVSKGYLSGPFNYMPFKNFRISPICLAEYKYCKKKRLNVDLSAPHDNLEHSSLNELIDKSDFFTIICYYR